MSNTKTIVECNDQIEVYGRQPNLLYQKNNKWIKTLCTKKSRGSEKSSKGSHFHILSNIVFPFFVPPDESMLCHTDEKNWIL